MISVQLYFEAEGAIHQKLSDANERDVSSVNSNLSSVPLNTK